MIFVNKTKIPDKVLRPLVRAALGRAGVQSTKVGVDIKPSKYYLSGSAQKCDFWRPKGKWLSVQGGWFEVLIPQPRKIGNRWTFHFGDSLDQAEDIWRVLVHEAKHIADYQAGLQFSNGAVKRRPTHDKRPEEIRANFVANSAGADLRKGRASAKLQDLILDLAIALETLRKESMADMGIE